MRNALRSGLILFVTAALLFSIVGCKNRKVQSGELELGEQVEVSGKVTISYTMATSEKAKSSVNEFVTAFKKEYPDVTVNKDFTSNPDATAARISSGEIGDVFFFWEEQTYDYAVTHKALMPLDAYIEELEIDTDNVYSGILDLGMVRGKTYMVARDYTHVVMFYNATAVVEEGLSKPEDGWTWDEFKSYCNQLTKRDESGNYLQVGANIDFTYAPYYIPFLEGWGGSWYDEVEKKITLSSDERVLTGVMEMYNQMNIGNMKPYMGSVSNSEISKKYSKVDETTGYVFQANVFPGLYAAGESYENKKVEWDIVSFPKTPVKHKVGVGATGFGVYNRTSNPGAAAALALFLYTEEGQRAYNSAVGGSVPNVKSLADEDFWRVPYEAETLNYDAFISYPEADTVGKIQCRVPTAVATIIVSNFSNLFGNALSGRVEISDGLKNIETKAQEKWNTLMEE